mmetsp:Transcript_34176/g.39856  ORF Transcript_34176/g.39856 Transcript_34176/m.39856 type:complete len:420 (+) Transcript_34176:53-1312(+)
MQKAFIAITLALTLTCAFAGYSATNWVKTPVSFLADSDSNFTNTTTFELGGLTTSDVNVIAYNAAVPVDTKNDSNSKWSVFTKTIATKDLSSSANSSWAFNAPTMSGIQFGYAIGFGSGNDTNNIPQIFMYQTKINGNTAVPRVTITSNTNANFTPEYIGGGGAAWKSLVFFYLAADKKVNYTSVTIGGSTLGKEFTLSTTWNTSTDGIECDWGEALSSSQVFAAYTEAGVYKVAVIDFGTGTLIGSGNVAGKYQKEMTCSPYVTDKKYYGLLCRNTTGDGVNKTLTLFVSSNTTTDVVQMGNASNYTTTQFYKMHQYAGYLSIFYQNPSTSNATVISYETWDVSALTTFVAKKDILTYDPATSGFDSYVIPQGGMFGLLYNYNGTVKSSIQVGQVMGASSLTTIFGALVTIVAGLFLF